MFAAKPQSDPGLEKAIAHLLAVLDATPTWSEHYAKTADQLAKLYAIRDNKDSTRISPDTLITVGGNLLGILVIVMYESRNVLTSKALGFITKAAR
jgi:hypothetical protein